MRNRYVNYFFNYLAYLVIAAFATWGLFGLGQTVFTYDEASIIDPAISLVERGYMSIPSAGPGHGHESAYLYQLPLYHILLAGVFRIFGVGLLQGRLLSLLLAVVVLVLVYLIMRRYGPLERAIAVSVLAVDWRFSFSAREIRYDLAALVGMLGAYALLSNWMPSRRSQTSTRVRWPVLPFLGGVMAGLAFISHFQYVLTIPLFVALMVLLPADVTSPLRLRFQGAIAFCLGALLPTTPVGVYVLRNWEAFRDQLLFHIVERGGQSETPIVWLLKEGWKYWSYYARWRPVPLLLFLNVGAVAILVVWISRLRIPREQHDIQLILKTRSLQRLAGVVIIFPVLVGVSSQHQPWYHLMVVPFWAMACGASAMWVRQQTKSIRIICAVFLALALANGLVASWGQITYSALRGWGARHVEVVESQITNYIPDGSSVYSTDYRFYFIARRHQWRFVNAYYFLNIDFKALAQEKFDYVIASPDWEVWTPASRVPFDLTRYHLTGVVYQERTTKFPAFERLVQAYFVPLAQRVGLNDLFPLTERTTTFEIYARNQD